MSHRTGSWMASSLTALLAASTFPNPAGAQVDFSELTLVDESVSVSLSGARYDRRTGVFSSTATVTKTSSDPIPAPVYLAVVSISQPGVAVANEDGISVDGTPYFVLLSDGELAVGESVLKRIEFTNPQRLRFTFVPAVYAGVEEPPAQGTVPDMVGLPQLIAESAIADASYVVGMVTVTNSDTIPAGLVANQDPPPGVALEPGSPVHMVLSFGPAGFAGLTFSLDDSITPHEPELPPFEDGVARPMASVSEDFGDQMDFVENELLVLTDDPDALGDFLTRWGGEVLRSEPTGDSAGTAMYLVRVSPDLMGGCGGSGAQRSQIALSNPTPADDESFGSSVAISGDKALVGAPFDSTGAYFGGSAYLFDASDGSLLHTFVGTNEQKRSGLGRSVAVSGNNILIGEPWASNTNRAGAVHLYDATTGAFLRTFTTPDPLPYPADFDQFGLAVAASGNHVLIAAPKHLYGLFASGQAYLFDATTGAHLQTFNNPTPERADWFGYAVAIRGDHVVIGAYRDGTASLMSGTVYLFDAATGNLQRTFNDPDARQGYFGESVDVFGDQILIGASGIGRAFLFHVDGTLLQVFSNPSSDGNFGRSVAIHGDRLIIGSSSGGTADAYLYHTDGRLLEAIVSPYTGDGNDQFGRAVAMDGDRIVFGAPGTDDAGATYTGKAYIYERGAQLCPALTANLRATNPARSGHFRVSNESARSLLGAIAAERAAGLMRPRANWQPRRFEIDHEAIGSVPLIAEPNCAYILTQQLRALEFLAERGGCCDLEGGCGGQFPPEDIWGGACPEGLLGLTFLDPSDCREPTPQFDLTINGLTLDEVSCGSEVLFILNPPASVPDGFTMEITGAYGDFTTGSLYGSALRLRPIDQVTGEVIVADSLTGRELVLYTPGTTTIPSCARTETFIVSLTHPDGETVSDFEVTLPLRFRVRGFDLTYGPGDVADFELCACGDQGPRTWEWIQTGGDPFPPDWLSLVQSPTDGRAWISGTVGVISYHSVGRIRVQQGTHAGEAESSIQVFVDFYPTIGQACSGQQVLKTGLLTGMPSEPFSCELPRPVGYDETEFNWSLAPGFSLPDGLSLVQNGVRWSVEGAVDPNTVAVGQYTVNLWVIGRGFLLREEVVTFDVGFPLRVWTQNMFLRPNNPFVPNTGDDNHDRANLFLNRIQNFDIMAIQEAFDDEQRTQLSVGATARQFTFLSGPTEEDSLLEVVTTTEDSGLALLIRYTLLSPSFDPWSDWLTLVATNHNELFTAACHEGSCHANKGFSVSRIPFVTHVSNPGFGEHKIIVVNTHTQADEEDTWPGTRALQLAQIMAYVSTTSSFATHPVLLMGDLNIIAGSGEYHARFADSLSGWMDVYPDTFPSTPYTYDQTQNAYAHFWDDHLDDHPGDEDTIHPGGRGRLDYILIHQGSEYGLVVESVQMEDNYLDTPVCRDVFPMGDHPGLRCYMSDHYGMSAELRFVKFGPGEP